MVGLVTQTCSALATDLSTVEHPNKRHFGNLISDVALFRGQKRVNAMVKGPGGVSFVGRSSLNLLLEVPLYSHIECV